MGNTNQNSSDSRRTADVRIEQLEDRQYRSGTPDIGINVTENSSRSVAKALPILKALNVTTVRLWGGIDNFNDRSMSAGLQRAIDYHNAGYDVTLTINSDDKSVPDPSAVKAWFQWATSNTALKNAVDRWEIGNEVDSRGYFNGSLRQYVSNELKPAAEALHAAGEKVISAGVSWNPDDIREMVGYGLLDMVDYVGFHPYAKGVSQQRNNIAEVRDVVGGRRPLVATEWNVRGFEGDKTQWAQAVHDAYGQVHAGFDLDYYFTLFTINTPAGPAGLMHTDGSLNTSFYRAFLSASQGVATSPPDLGGSTPGDSTGGSSGNTPSSAASQVALYDTDTERVISGYTDIKAGSVIDLAKLPSRHVAIVVVAGKSATSMKMTLNGKSDLQNDMPYAFYGDDGWSHLHDGHIGVGSYNMAMTSYTKENGKGTAFGSRSVKFSFIDSHATTPTTPSTPSTPSVPTTPVDTTHDADAKAEITSYTLVDARTGRPIEGYGHITSSTTIKLSSLPTRDLALAANGDDDTRSIKVKTLQWTHVEINAPFAFFGDQYGKYSSWNVKPGKYDFSAVAYGTKNGTGHAGGTLALSLKFV